MSECVDEFGVIPYCDLESLAVETFEDVEPAPRSIYDVHQEAIFIAGMSYYDTAIAKQLQTAEEYAASHRYDSDNALRDIQYVATNLEQGRNELLASKILYEMDRGNDSALASLIPGIANYHQKLRILEYALRHTDENVATTALMWLGNLRGEAEAAQDPQMLAAYLMVELRSGVNVHGNIVDMHVLRETCGGDLTVEYDKFVEQFIFDLVRSGKYDYARVMSEYSLRLTPEAVELFVKAHTHRVQLESKHALEKSPRKNKRKRFDLVHSAYSPEDFVVAAIAFPETVNEKTIQARIHNNEGLGDKRGLYLDCLTRAQMLCETDAEQGGIGQARFDNSRAEQVYHAKLNTRPPYNGTYYNELFVAAATLSLHADESDIEEFSQLSDLEAAVDVAVVDLSTRKCTLMDDIVDNIRFQTDAQNTVKELFAKIAAIRDQAAQFRMFAKIMRLDIEFAGSAHRLAYAGKIKDAALRCLANPVTSLSISQEEVLDTCKELGISLEHR